MSPTGAKNPVSPCVTTSQVVRFTCSLAASIANAALSRHSKIAANARSVKAVPRPLRRQQRAIKPADRAPDRLLGEGVFGRVYEAFDTRLRRPVALKILTNPVNPSQDAELRHLLAEARALAALQHRNVVTVFDIAEHEGVPYLTMELLRGRSLAAISKSGQSTTAEKLRWLREIGETTGTIHFCIPYSTLEPIRDVLYSTIQGDSNEPDRRWVTLMKQQITAAEVEIVAELAKAPATVEQLLAFKPGDFIELDLEAGIQGKVVGVPIFDCHYGTSNGRYALKIDRMLSSSNLTWLGENNVS